MVAIRNHHRHHRHHRREEVDHRRRRGEWKFGRRHVAIVLVFTPSAEILIVPTTPPPDAMQVLSLILPRPLEAAFSVGEGGGSARVSSGNGQRQSIKPLRDDDCHATWSETSQAAWRGVADRRTRRIGGAGGGKERTQDRTCIQGKEKQLARGCLLLTSLYGFLHIEWVYRTAAICTNFCC